MGGVGVGNLNLGGVGGTGPGGYPSAGDPTHPNRVLWQQAALGAAQPEQQQPRQPQQPQQSQQQQQPREKLEVGSRPVFIHIPKTGGTSIELTAARRGVKLGACASTCPVLDNTCEGIEASQAYPVQPGYEKCSRLHRPPRFSNGVIPNSFCVIRNPFDRLVSEFNYWRLMPWVQNPAEDTCGDFERWVEGVASSIIDNKMMACHLATVTNDHESLDAGGCRDDRKSGAAQGGSCEACHTIAGSEIDQSGHTRKRSG